MRANQIVRCGALLLAGSLGLFTACGGGSGGGNQGGGGGGPQTVELASIASQDGKLIYSVVFGTLIDTAQAPVLGYNVFGELEMGFYTFDLSQIPAGATVDSAIFEAEQLNTVLNPQNVVGPVCLAHAPALASSPAVTELVNPLEDPIRDGSGLAEILSFTQQPGLRTMEVTSQVRRDISEGRNRSRFRLTGSWALLVNGVAGFYVFEDTPVLRVTYRP